MQFSHVFCLYQNKMKEFVITLSLNITYIICFITFQKCAESLWISYPGTFTVTKKNNQVIEK